jgi:predicted oxidoreductase
MLPMVDAECRILDAQGTPLDGIYGIGLASGFVPHGSLGGEESFKGQANSLWLWQHDLGLKIVRSVLAAAETASASDTPVPEVPIPSVQDELAGIA